MQNKQQTSGHRPGGAATRWIVVVAVVAVAIGAYVLRPAAGGDAAAGNQDTVVAEATKALPRMIDLGADKCVPCKMMAPILEELKTEYEGRMVIEFIDVWKNPSAGAQYGIKLIPTQIFYAADGTELYRHEGFYGRDDILGKWRELGIDL
ncbi:MAG: thioredoxin family protein [Krumholzibacteria bacterium]|nr:thioredoxin family protein [Candidatus Krumholzibacteria bacterium]